MEEQEIYKCEGTCQGVAHEPKNCGDETCTHFDKPLVKQENTEEEKTPD